MGIITHCESSPICLFEFHQELELAHDYFIALSHNLYYFVEIIQI